MKTIIVIGMAMAALQFLPALRSAAGAQPGSLKGRDKQYDPKEHVLLYPNGGGQWIHTNIQRGRVHPTRDSLRYAADLFDAGTADRIDRARKILAKVLTLQDKDPASRTCGVWSYFLEEPLGKMNNPDWNWADFLGLDLTRILAAHADKLPGDLLAAARAGLDRACDSIRRRDVGLGYTNIALLDCAVTAVAGEVLREPAHLAYGRKKLQRLIEFTRQHGSFTEYNSPTYTMVASGAAEHVLAHAKDPAARAAAKTLHQMAWTTITEHYHPGTGQWAGPHARCYRDLLGAGAADEWTRLGAASPHKGCPPAMAPRLRKLPRDPLEIRRRFWRGGEGRMDIHGTTWFTEDACLGSVSYEDLWYQRRVLIAYWKMAGAAPAVLRMRFLKDDKDFCSAVAHNVQKGPRVLSAVTTITGRGEYHPSIGRPKDGVFHGKDFRLRYELTADGARAAALGDGRFMLSAGARKAVIHTAPGSFGDTRVVWRCGSGKGRAFVDAVCYAGPKRDFRFDTFAPVLLTAGLELLPKAADAPETPLTIHRDGDKPARITWSDLSLPAPPPGRAYRR